MRSIIRPLALALCVLALPAFALDYQLVAREIAPGVHVVEGETEHFSFENGGNIVNTGFIITEAGVVVIDSGPSKRYGEALRREIEALTEAPILRLYITHAHPDHFLGNQAFADVPIMALPATRTVIADQGDLFAQNLYRLVGDWMRGTEVQLPAETAVPGTVELGGRRLRLLAMGGHSDADLVVLDETSGVLFAGDLVFYQRAATTPHADLDQWLQALDRLDGLTFEVLVPGHGPVVRDGAAIQQTRAYLQWLDATMKRAAQEGMDMAELLYLQPPDRFLEVLSVLPEEYQRSVTHLYPAQEARALPQLVQERP